MTCLERLLFAGFAVLFVGCSPAPSEQALPSLMVSTAAPSGVTTGCAGAGPVPVRLQIAWTSTPQVVRLVEVPPSSEFPGGFPPEIVWPAGSRVVMDQGLVVIRSADGTVEYDRDA